MALLPTTDAADGNRDLRMGDQNGALHWNRASDDAALPEQSCAGAALGVPLPTGRWSCLEFMVDGGAADTLWIDDVLGSSRASGPASSAGWSSYGTI